MTNDPSIREQSYHYFLQEAPELLQVLEQDLLSLREDYSINKVNTLMRTTHTLKGAAASVGLETIKTVAHSLEDIFKALFNPNLKIDPEVEALLFEGYECLRLPLTAELTGGQVNDAEILDRTAAIFAQLQEKLGDCFGQEAYIPTSIELGFDVTQSIFEVGVNQRLNEIATVIADADPDLVATTIRTQAEVFVGLAESLNLPGFGAIAEFAIAALNSHPEQVMTIAQTALADFQAAQAAVFAGDRRQGGQPSLALQQLAGLIYQSTEPTIDSDAPVIEVVVSQDEELLKATEESLTVTPPYHITPIPTDGSDVNVQESATELESIWGTSAADSELSRGKSDNEESNDPLLESIWGGTEEPETTGEREQESNPEIQALTPSPKQPEVTIKLPLSRQLRTDSVPPLNPQKDQVSQSGTVRVNVENLEHLNYSIGELLTNQNRQLLQNEQVQTAVRSLLTRLRQHQQLLGQLQDWSDRQFTLPEQRRTEAGHSWQSPFRFDSLELDRYTESQILVQSILEDAVQLAEASEAIDLFTHQSNQTLDKQRRLLTSARDSLMQARMLPLGEIFGRFHRVLQQLEIRHNKQVALELHGTDVLVDKVVVEKLYDPLLHLVRNAFDHGIESATVRQQRGKASKGQIEICAYHRGRYLVIEVRDDGQGLDFERIRRQAIDRQLVSPEQASSLNEAQLTDLLFEPGFSTASEVNDLSGRGIGLDVVRSQLQALQGAVSVYSEPYQGTMFILQIPLSLTISKLLLTQAGDQVYALLSDAIEQILIPQTDQIRSWEEGKVLRWGKGAEERLIPIHRLSKILDYCTEGSHSFGSEPKPLGVSQGKMMPVILIRHQDRLLGLEVDQLLGEQELVIRRLGGMILPPSYVYGGSILADGQLTLVLDGAALMQCVFDQQTNNSTVQMAVTPPLLNASLQQRQLPAYSHPALPASPDPALKARSEKMVLLVDDSITLRQTLALTLQKAGYQVLQAKDGYEAIEQLRQQKNIRLVICDIEMPRMNGFEFLKHRQQDQSLLDIPVVILTSRSASKHRLIASELGATAYITKPYLEHKLLSAVTEVIEQNILNSVVSS